MVCFNAILRIQFLFYIAEQSNSGIIWNASENNLQIYYVEKEDNWKLSVMKLSVMKLAALNLH